MFSIVHLCHTCSPLCVINIPPSPGPTPLGGVSASLGGIALPEKKEQKKSAPQPPGITERSKPALPVHLKSIQPITRPNDAGRDVFLLSASDRLFIGPCQAAPIV